MANFDVSYFPSYFNIDDILASQDKVPCKFEVPVKGLGKCFFHSIMSI